KQFAVAGRTVHAVRDVSFALAPGALCAIVGPSGSGKSTLLALLGGLDVPTWGEVWIGAANVGRMSAARRTRFRAANVGFVFQAHNLVPVLTAAENVALPLTLLPLSGRARARRAGVVTQRPARSREPWPSASSDSPSATSSVTPGVPSLPPPPSRWLSCS